MGFIKSAAKKSLLALTKKGELTPRFWARFFEAFVTKDELISFADSGAVDHGLLDGLTDDDHTQYYNSVRHTALSHSFVDHTDLQSIGTNTHAQIDTHVGNGTIHFTEGSIDHGSIAGLGDDDHLQYLTRSDWRQNGFWDAPTETALAWNDGTLTLTLSPAVTSFKYFYDGMPYTESGDLAATITDTEGLWLFYIASGGAASLSTIMNPTSQQVEDAILDEVLVAYVYWDAANNDGRLLDERHGSNMSPEIHHYLHETQGAKYFSGMTPGDILVDQNGSSDTHAQISITAGRFYDEDIQHDTLAHAATDTWECYYVDGSGYVRWVDCEATFPVYAIGGVIAYNNAGTLTAVGSQKYVLYHIFSTNIHTDAGANFYPVVTPGVAEYSSKALAQDAALTEIQAIDFGEWPTEEVVPIATVIFLRGAAMSNGVTAAIISTEGGGDFIDWRYAAVTGSSTSVNDHGALSGLGDDDHPQYLPLTAGSGKPLTGDLYLDKTSSPQVVLREGGSGTSLSIIKDSGTEAWINHYESAASSGIVIDPLVGDGSSNATLYMFLQTSTTGTRVLNIYEGDGTATVQHSFNAGTGDVDLCQQGGGLKVSNGYVRLPYLAGAPASPANGMIWMESDGLHIYYAGAEKVVAGV